MTAQIARNCIRPAVNPPLPLPTQTNHPLQMTPTKTSPSYLVRKCAAFGKVSSGLLGAGVASLVFGAGPVGAAVDSFIGVGIPAAPAQYTTATNWSSLSVPVTSNGDTALDQQWFYRQLHARRRPDHQQRRISHDLQRFVHPGRRQQLPSVGPARSGHGHGERNGSGEWRDVQPGHGFREPVQHHWHRECLHHHRWHREHHLKPSIFSWV